MTAVRIRIGSETRKELEEVLRRALRAGDLAVVKRVTALLAIARAGAVPAIAEGIGVSASTVYQWLHRFLAVGMEGLRVHWRGGHLAEVVTADPVSLTVAA